MLGGLALGCSLVLNSSLLKLALKLLHSLLTLGKLTLQRCEVRVVLGLEQCLVSKWLK